MSETLKLATSSFKTLKRWIYEIVYYIIFIWLIRNQYETDPFLDIPNNFY